MKSSILSALVYHKRYQPIEYVFSHKVFYLVVNLFELEELKKLKLFSINQRNLFTVSWQDYGFGDIDDPKKYILNILDKFSLNSQKVKQITLITIPKIMGYCFNPVSFWLCFDKDDNLCLVMAEVNNTFGERHAYLCFNENLNPIEASDVFNRNKMLHVSPFCNVEGHYQFQFDLDKKNININIDYYKEEKKLIATSIKGKKIAFNNKNLLINCFTYSLMVIKIIFLIHYHAFWLWIKKVPFIKKPAKAKTNITLS